MSCDKQWVTFLILTISTITSGTIVCLSGVLIYQTVGISSIGNYHNIFFMIGLILGTFLVLIPFLVHRRLTRKLLTCIYIFYSIYIIFILFLGLLYFFTKENLIASVKKIWTDSKFAPIAERLQQALSCCGLSDPVPKNISCNTNLVRCLVVIQSHLSVYSTLMSIFWFLILITFGFIIANLIKLICTKSFTQGIDFNDLEQSLNDVEKETRF